MPTVAQSKLTPAQRRQRARIAALMRWAKEDRDPKELAARGQAGLLAKFAGEIDPDGKLPEDERMRRAERMRQAHLEQLSYRAKLARQARKSPDTGEAA